MHGSVREWVGACIQDPANVFSVVEVGSLDVNGTLRDLLEGVREYYGVDLVDGPGVTDVGDGATFQPRSPVDMVICCEVLEHAENWRDVVANCVSMLRPGGVFVGTCATVGRDPHGAYGERSPGFQWYENVVASDLVALLAGLSERFVVDVAGPDLRWQAVRT